ncbi:SDR family oxidoreductase [Variovorax sp. ZS18.2.2]|uniref:SDR family NAD(P)-dependent oxidoreductase n=1 Tax=Variovorax sp. ZS18.2.2 TaxID=2971255 RepID=UPI002151BFDA|nr:SDR family oxidoreductase [Variovorax sp. ZS18.2.2]MCR6477174.1 SDR family oxidoreductase [Variovorax sp. ZS18.2.2]
MENLANKVAVVTGASKGIGAAIAKGLASNGAAVVVNYGGDRAGADRVVAEIAASGGKARAVQADVSKKEEVQRLFKEASEAFGVVNVLVNNAGVFAPGPLEAMTEADFHRHFDINVLGTLLATQAFAEQSDGNGASVINITSSSVENPGPNSVLPVASKTAVAAITRVLAAELGPRKIRVNSVAPGPTDTDGLRKLGVGSAIVDYVVSTTPMGRMGQTEDVAPVVVFLASDEGGWVTGNHILASGGAR